MSIRYLVGDVRELLLKVPDGSVDLIATSPPYLALRSYLPPDHPDKAKEIGSEALPAEFIAVLLELTAEFRRVLAPHGSIAIELGDTYAGSGGAGGDYGVKLGGDDAGSDRSGNGRSRPLREGQPKFVGSAAKRGRDRARASTDGGGQHTRAEIPGWPLERCLSMVPEMYRVALAYGIHPLTGEASPAGRWRVRNVVVHGRPNPPVGDPGGKMRPACSYWAVACLDKRWFDEDALRNGTSYALDWIDDRYDEDLWTIPTSPYRGAHFATFSPELIRRFIVSMCPPRVCTVCGKASRRLTKPSAAYDEHRSEDIFHRFANKGDGALTRAAGRHGSSRPKGLIGADYKTLGWTDCGCGAPFRPGLVLDPFAGTGTTLMVAAGNGRDAIGFDLDEGCLDLARQRCGMFLDESEGMIAP